MKSDVSAYNDIESIRPLSGVNLSKIKYLNNDIQKSHSPQSLSNTDNISDNFVPNQFSKTFMNERSRSDLGAVNIDKINETNGKI
jgi:hypothetical protein